MPTIQGEERVWLWKTKTKHEKALLLSVFIFRFTLSFLRPILPSYRNQICSANQLTGFYMMVTLVIKGLSFPVFFLPFFLGGGKFKEVLHKDHTDKKQRQRYNRWMNKCIYKQINKYINNKSGEQIHTQINNWKKVYQSQHWWLNFEMLRMQYCTNAYSHKIIVYNAVLWRKSLRLYKIDISDRWFFNIWKSLW